MGVGDMAREVGGPAARAAGPRCHRIIRDDSTNGRRPPPRCTISGPALKRIRLPHTPPAAHALRQTALAVRQIGTRHGQAQHLRHRLSLVGQTVGDADVQTDAQCLAAILHRRCADHAAHPVGKLFSALQADVRRDDGELAVADLREGVFLAHFRGQHLGQLAHDEVGHVPAEAAHDVAEIVDDFAENIPASHGLRSGSLKLISITELVWIAIFPIGALQRCVDSVSQI